jgi:hypothetical protein
MKVDEYRDDLANAQASFSLPLYFASRKHLLPPDGYKDLAEVIDIAKQFG